MAVHLIAQNFLSFYKGIQCHLLQKSPFSRDIGVLVQHFCYHITCLPSHILVHTYMDSTVLQRHCTHVELSRGNVTFPKDCCQSDNSFRNVNLPNSRLRSWKLLTHLSRSSLFFQHPGRDVQCSLTERRPKLCPRLPLWIWTNNFIHSVYISLSLWR